MLWFFITVSRISWWPIAAEACRANVAIARNRTMIYRIRINAENSKISLFLLELDCDVDLFHPVIFFFFFFCCGYCCIAIYAIPRFLLRVVHIPGIIDTEQTLCIWYARMLISLFIFVWCVRFPWGTIRIEIVYFLSKVFFRSRVIGLCPVTTSIWIDVTRILHFDDGLISNITTMCSMSFNVES